MKVIYARSPYTIVIDEATQVASKIELRLWHKGESKPTDPTYTLSKRNPSTVQIHTEYNIATYIKDFLINIYPYTELQIDEEENSFWVYVEVITFYTEDDIDYTLLNTLDFIGINGFTNYSGGANQISDDVLVYLTNPLIDIQTNLEATVFSDSKNIPYFNVLVDWQANTGEELRYIYKDLNNLSSAFVTVLNDADTVGIYCFKVPYRKNGSAYINGNKVEVRHTGRLTNYKEINYITVCEQKYTPVRCDFINGNGGWQPITFFKAKTDSIEIKSSQFNLLPSGWNYNPSQGLTKDFNFVGTQSVVLNTGWVDENFFEILLDLFLSETILLDGVPVSLKSKSLPKKTSIKDKMINYTVDFTYSFNLINDVQ